MDEYISRKYLEDIVDYHLSHSNGAEHYAYGIIRGEVRVAQSADVVPVDKIIFQHILIDENGIPEVKLQFGERTLTLRREGDPVNVREIVHGHWEQKKHKLFRNTYDYVCSVCGCDYALAEYDYCPNCGSKMDKGN